jgi:hypothetical protein
MKDYLKIDFIIGSLLVILSLLCFMAAIIYYKEITISKLITLVISSISIAINACTSFLLWKRELRIQRFYE